MSTNIKPNPNPERGDEEDTGEKGNPFARRSGLSRSPPRTPWEGDNVEEERGGQEELPVEVKMDGPTLTKVIRGVMTNHEESGGEKMEVITDITDVITSFLDNRHNYSRDLKMAVLTLCDLVVEAKAEWRSLLEASKEAECKIRSLMAEKEEAVLLQEKTVKEMETLRKETELKIRLLTKEKQLAESQTAELQARMAKNGATPKLGRVTQEADPPKAPKQKEKAGPSAVRKSPPQAKHTIHRDEGLRWTEVVNPKKVKWEAKQAAKAEKEAKEAARKKAKKGRALEKKGAPSKPAERKRKDRGEAIVVHSGNKSYAEVLKAMRSCEKLSGLGGDVNCIRRTQKGEMILVLKRDAAQKSSEYKKLTEEVLGDGVTVKALCPVATIQCKGLDEITVAGDLVDALRDQCNVEIQESGVRLRKSFAGMQVATFQVPLAESKKVLEKAKLKVGWSICHLTISQPPQTCYRCLVPGHRSYDCKGPDRSKLCRRCGVEGHLARTCQAAPRCLICPKGTDNRHPTGAMVCPTNRRVQTCK